MLRPPTCYHLQLIAEIPAWKPLLWLLLLLLLRLATLHRNAGEALSAPATAAPLTVIMCHEYM